MFENIKLGLFIWMLCGVAAIAKHIILCFLRGEKTTALDIFVGSAGVLWIGPIALIGLEDWFMDKMNSFVVIEGEEPED